MQAGRTGSIISFVRPYSATSPKLAHRARKQGGLDARPLVLELGRLVSGGRSVTLLIGWLSAMLLQMATPPGPSTRSVILLMLPLNPG